MFPVCVLTFDLLSEMGVNLWAFHVWLAHLYIEAKLIIKVMNEVQHVLEFGRDWVCATDSEGFFVLDQCCLIIVEISVYCSH